MVVGGSVKPIIPVEHVWGERRSPQSLTDVMRWCSPCTDHLGEKNMMQSCSPFCLLVLCWYLCWIQACKKKYLEIIEISGTYRTSRFKSYGSTWTSTHYPIHEAASVFYYWLVDEMACSKGNEPMFFLFGWLFADCVVSP